MTTQNRWPGVPLALASAILFGASTPSAKLLLAHEDPEAALSRKSTELETFDDRRLDRRGLVAVDIAHAEIRRREAQQLRWAGFEQSPRQTAHTY